MAEAPKKGAAPEAKGADAKGAKAPKGEGRGKKGSGQQVAAGRAQASVKGYVPRIKQVYDETVRAKMIEEFGYKNPMEVPRIDKIVINMGVGESVNDSKKAAQAADDLALIVGQKPVVTRARKAISNFKVRENMPIGCKVTLRKTRMYEFVDRLVTIALPRVRDFRGLNPKSFDGRGNFAIGMRDHTVFYEINYDQNQTSWGMDVIVCTTAKTDDEARALLKHLNFPFRQ